MIEREKLEKLLLNSLQGLSSTELNKLRTELAKKNILPGEPSSLRRELKKFEELENRELFWYADALNTIFGEDYNGGRGCITLSNFFSEKEITFFGTSQRGICKIEYPIIFEDVQQVESDQWSCVISADSWKKMYDNQIIAYNFETQRNPLLRYTNNGEEFKVINTNQKNVKEIEESILSGTFIPNTLTLNVNLDNPENEWDYDGKRFFLLKGQFDIIDGFHRYRALINAKGKNPDLNINFKCALVAFDTYKAKRFIGQENKRTPLPKSYAKSLDNKLSNMVIQRLNDDSTSLLYKQIGVIGKYVINSAEMAALIDGLEFGLFSNADVLRFKNNLKKYFEDIFNALPELLDRRITYDELAVILGVYKLHKDDSIKIILECFKYLDELEVKKWGVKITKGNKKKIEKFIEKICRSM